MSKTKIIYLLAIRDLNVYKVGISSNVEKRIKTLQTGCPYKLEILKTFQSPKASKIEKVLHRQYSSKKIDENEYSLKGEWFYLGIKTIINFKEICSQIEFDLKLIEKPLF